MSINIDCLTVIFSFLSQRDTENAAAVCNDWLTISRINDPYIEELDLEGTILHVKNGGVSLIFRLDGRLGVICSIRGVRVATVSTCKTAGTVWSHGVACSPYDAADIATAFTAAKMTPRVFYGIFLRIYNDI